MAGEYLTRQEVSKICPDCASKMSRLKITRLKKSVLLEKLSKAKEQEVTEVSNGTAVLVFQAEWCGVCLKTRPEIDQLIKKLNGGVKLVLVDVDICPQLAARFKVSSLPVVLVIRNQKERKRWGADVKASDVLSVVQ